MLYLAPGALGVVRSEHIVAGRRGREIAVKLILPREEYLDYQLPEMIKGVGLNHRHIVTCFSAGETKLKEIRLLYVLLELANEGSLADQLKRENLSVRDGEVLGFQLGSALEYLHSEQQRPLVHRDLKPANILRIGSDWKLSDFGTVREMHLTTMSRTEVQFGTSHYMPPESFDYYVSPAWDVWSLGIVLFESLTGTRPFDASSIQELKVQIVEKEAFIPPRFLHAWRESFRGAFSRTHTSVGRLREYGKRSILLRSLAR